MADLTRFSPGDPIFWTYTKWFPNSYGSVIRYGHFLRYSQSGQAVLQILGNKSEIYVDQTEVSHA